MAEKESWHLDKRVPIALILVLLIQTGGAIWWASSQSARMDNAEKRIEELITRNNGTSASVERNARDVAVLTAEIKALTSQFERLYAQGEATNQLLRQIVTGGDR